MATWDLWMPDVVIHAIAAPDPLIRQAINRSAREFFRRTRAWKEWMDGTASMAGATRDYDFEIPVQAEIVRIERATRNGEPMAIESFNARASDWTQHEGSSIAVVSRDLVSYTLTGNWAAGDVVQLSASFMPTLAATQIPDHLAQRYLEPITAGALAKLLMTPDTPFYKPDLAGMNKMIFEEEIAMATVDAWRGHTNIVPRATPSWC